MNSKDDIGFVPKEKFTDLYNKIADSFFNFYSYRNAVAFYDTLLVDDPENVELKFQKARAVAKYDDEKALLLFKELSSQPLFYSESLLETGKIYYSRKDEDGKIIAKDRKKGLILYKRSAELGNAKAVKILENIEKEKNDDEHKEKIIDW